MDGVDHTNDRLSDHAFPTAADAKRRIEVDVERYQHLLDNPDLTEEQKAQMLEALWSIIVNFVELGWGVHPMQKACGKLCEDDAESGNSAPDRVELDDQPD